MAVLLVVLTLSVAQRISAAIELAYYRASSTDVSVLLEWATAREVNLDGFEILCKRAIEMDTEYHPIGSRIAQGGPETPATYSFNVTTGLTYGEAYCFRLREVTNDDTPGEEFDVCGYGPGVTPTAGDAVPADASLTLTPTAIIVENTAGVAGPTFTPTAISGQSPLLTPAAGTVVTSSVALTVTPTVTVVPGQSESPLPTPQAVDPNAGIAGNPAESVVPTLTPTLAPTATPTVTPTATITPTATVTPTPTETQPSSPLAVVPAGDGAPPIEPETDPATLEPAVNALPATPTPIYLVVTATPTPNTAAAVIQPTFTPWPTATAALATFDFAGLLVPSTQNMMVMLLCLIFLSASGLGVLGLITSVLYMRSQTRRTQLPGPIYGRRRY